MIQKMDIAIDYLFYFSLFVIFVYPTVILIRFFWEKAILEKKNLESLLQHRANFTIKNPLFIIYYSKLLDAVKRIDPEYNIFYNVPLRTYGYKTGEKASYVVVNKKSVPVLFVFVKNRPKLLKNFAHDFIVLRSIKDIEKIEGYLGGVSSVQKNVLAQGA